MGIIRFFKQLAALHKIMKDLPQELERQSAAYCAMSHEELSALPDEELFAAALRRIENTMADYEEIKNGFSALSEPQKVVFAVNYLEMEVNNGGLCQFFVNSSRAVAPYISEYLGILGADGHKQLFDGFISKHQIDLNDLSSFEIRRVKDFEKQAQRYPFDEYDDAFYDLPSLEEPLTAYIKANLTAF